MDTKEEKETKKKRLEFLTVSLIIYLTSTLFACQWFIFDTGQKRALSILIGTCSVMVGGFSALLASPYGLSDKERLSRVGSTISTLVTGYIVAKIIDPIIAAFTTDGRTSAIFVLENGANVLIAITGFLAGFIFVYQYRVYISGELLEKEEIYTQALHGLEKIVKDKDEERLSRKEALISIFKIDEERGKKLAQDVQGDPVLEESLKDIMSKIK